MEACDKSIISSGNLWEFVFQPFLFPLFYDKVEKRYYSLLFINLFYFGKWIWDMKNDVISFLLYR